MTVLWFVIPLLVLAGCTTVAPTPMSSQPVVMVITGVRADHTVITEPLRQVAPTLPARATEVSIAFVNTERVNLGIEGALLFLRATTFEGDVVLDRIVKPRGDTQRLASSDYTLTAYFRSCDGNCLLLDPPEVLCSVDDVSIGDSGVMHLVVNMQERSCLLSVGV